MVSEPMNTADIADEGLMEEKYLFPTSMENEVDSSYFYSMKDDQSCSMDDDRYDGSIAQHQENHPVDVDELKKSIKEGNSHARGGFSYFIDHLPIRSHINRNVDLDEMLDLEFLTEGSHSHVFSATWKSKPVIIKVIDHSHLSHYQILINNTYYFVLLLNGNIDVTS